MNKLVEIKNAFTQLGAGGFAMKRRLRVYLLSLVAALMALILVLLSAFGLFTSVNDDVFELLDAHMNTYAHDVQFHFRSVAAHGVRLADRLAADLDETLSGLNATREDMNDNVELTTQAELAIFHTLESALPAADASGAFMIFNSTVNTRIERADTSRSCLYLKYANINISKPVNPEVFLFRGATDVSVAGDVTLHNQWDLEYDTEDLGGYAAPLFNSRTLIPEYCFTEALPVRDTWERAMYLAVPVYSRERELYGICGFEINAIYYKLTQGMAHSKLNHVAGVVARREGDTLYPDAGLESGMSDGWFGNVSRGPLRAEADGELIRYTGEDGAVYYGTERDISIGPALNVNGTEGDWVVSVMIPEEDYAQLANARSGVIAMFCVAFLAVAVAFCLFLSRRYVTPILTGLSRAREPDAAGKTGIVEIDDLLLFLSSNDPPPQAEQSQDADGESQAVQQAAEYTDSAETATAHTQQTPHKPTAQAASELASALAAPNLEGFEAFVRNTGTLSKAESAVFGLYMQGHTAREIAEIQHISINTVKTHNRHIYEKLNVSTYRELMVYVQMMKQSEK